MLQREGLDEDAITTTLFHDLLEDTDATEEVMNRYDEGLSYMVNKSCDNCGEVKKISICNHYHNLPTNI